MNTDNVSCHGLFGVERKPLKSLVRVEAVDWVGANAMGVCRVRRSGEILEDHMNSFLHFVPTYSICVTTESDQCSAHD